MSIRGVIMAASVSVIAAGAIQETAIAAQVIATPAPHAVRRHLDRVAAGGLLAFPYQHAAAASDLYCFALNPWSASGEIHGGIDVAAAHTGDQPTMLKAAVVAPAAGRVEWVVPGASGHGLASIMVLIRLNDFWFVAVNFEPQSASQATNDAQTAAMQVVPGQTVAAGQVIGDLVVWHVAAGSYPHVDIRLFYKNPSQTLEDVRDHVLEVAVSDGTALPPVSGPGSPADPRDLGIPTTWFCPYVYSTAQARAVYDALPAHAANGDLCACPCAYHSTAGDCGTCSR